MNTPGDSENYDHLSFVDGTIPPFSNDQDKLYSILNVLRGHEEFTLNIEGTIISSNLEAVNITRYEEWEVIGQHFSIFYSQEDLRNKQPENDLALSLKEGKMTSDSWKLRKRQIRFWARIKIIPLYDSLSSLRGYKLILRDASHKVFSDFHVQRVKNEYLNLYHNSIIGIIRFDKRKGLVKLANRKALEIIGITDFHNFSFGEAFLNKDDLDRFNTLMDQHRYVNNFEFQLRYDHGGKRWASVDCKFYVSSGFVEGIIVDVTEKKRQEIAVQKLSSDLNTFIYHASHDLRSPLTSIMGLLNLMDMASPASKNSDYSAMIRERIDHLDHLLKDLSIIAFNNHSEINYERVFVKEEIGFLLRNLLPSETKIQFLLDISDDTRIVSDVLRFRTIIKNLVSNAIKFYNQMERNPFVKITAISWKDQVAVIVEDNGIGIEKAEMEKLHTMFHRGHSSRSGSGLGLYIVRSMVDQLGGTIRISSAIGEGTKVTIELPAREL